MKNTWKMTAWAVIMVLTVALVLTNCGGDDGDDNGPNLTNGNFGETLTISGKQVYMKESTYTDIGYREYTYTPVSFEEATPVFATDYSDKLWNDYSEVGTISASGKLNLTISGAPVNTRPLTEFFNTPPFTYFTNLSINPNDAKYCHLIFSIFSDGGLSLNKSSATYTKNSERSESIGYLYVDKDVRVTGQGTTTSFEWGKYIFSNIDLQFKKGWNALYARMLETYNQDTDTWTGNYSTYIGDSSDLKWCIDASDY